MRGLGLLSGWIGSVWGAMGHRGLVSWVKHHSGCWLPPACYWLRCYWFVSLLLSAGAWHFSDLNKNCWSAQAGGDCRCPTPYLPERDHHSAENTDKVCAMREIGELDPYDLHRIVHQEDAWWCWSDTTPDSWIGTWVTCATTPLCEINFGGVGARGCGGATVQAGKGGVLLYPRPRTWPQLFVSNFLAPCQWNKFWDSNKVAHTLR